MDQSVYLATDSNIYLTRINKDQMANEEEIWRFEKSVMGDLTKGKNVFLIEQFPVKFFGYATKIRLEKVMEPMASLSEESNARLFKVVLTNSFDN